LGQPGYDPLNCRGGVVTMLKEKINTWRQDRLLQIVLRNSGYLFSSNTISMVLAAAQGFIAALLLGPAAFGVLGMVIMFASSVNRLLAFRMGELVIRFGGGYLATGHKQQAAAVIKYAGLAEAITSVAAYILLVALAPLAAVYIIKIPSSSTLIVYYGLALLVNMMTETCTAVMQVAGHYRTIALLNLSQSVLSMAWIGVVYLTGGGLPQVLTAYLAGKTLFGLGVMAMGIYWLRPLLGANWWRVSYRQIPDLRKMLSFAINTNLSGTINMLIRDSEVLWVGFFCNPLQAGYYKFALAVMNIILMPVTAIVSSTSPEINRSVAKRAWQPLRQMLSRTSIIAGVWTVACILGVLLFGPLVLSYLKHGAYLPSYPAILILMVGYGIANIFFWNRPLLLAFGQSIYPLQVNALAGLVKTALMFVFVPTYGFLAQAVLLSTYLAVTVGTLVLRGIREMRKSESGTVVESEV